MTTPQRPAPVASTSSYTESQFSSLGWSQRSEETGVLRLIRENASTADTSRRTSMLSDEESECQEPFRYSPSLEHDPLDALHKRNLSSHPALRTSILTDDESDQGQQGDPLEALHRHNLQCQSDLDTSVLTDDELVALLKGSHEPQSLAWLDLHLVPQTDPKDGSIFLAIQSPSPVAHHAES